MFAALTTIGVSAKSEFDTAGYDYDINHDGVISEDEEGVTITGFNGLNGGETVVIPAEIDDKPVFALGLNGVTGEHIPNAEKIGTLDLTQADNLMIIFPHAFSMCYNIVKVIGNDTVEMVGDDAFGFCAQITSINFPGCMTVGTGAFCITGLKPKQVTLADGCSIGSGAFELTQIKDLINDINYAKPRFETAAYEYDINHDRNISEDEKGVTITGFKNLNGGETVTIPAKIKGKKVLAIDRWGNYILDGRCIGRLDLTQAEYFKVIGAGAFEGCYNLKGTLESKTLERIEWRAFMDSCIEDVNLPSGCYIGDDAFFITLVDINKIREIYPYYHDYTDYDDYYFDEEW